MKKNNYWQMIRGICIVLVILIHVLYINNSAHMAYFNIIVRRIINFSTAVFIFIAGYFSKFVSVKEFYIKKIIRLLIPLIIWNIIYCFMLYFTDKLSVFSMIKLFLLVKTAPHLYYIVVLLQLFLLCPSLLKYINNTLNKRIVYIPLLITPLFVLFITFLRIYLHINIPLYNYWFFGWISYYYLGLLIRKKESIDRIKNKNNIIIPILCLLLTIFEGILLKKYFNLYDIAISQLTLSNSIYSISICILLYSNSHKSNYSKILCKIGNYSFGIYLSHILFLKTFKKIILLKELNYYNSIILIFIFTIVSVYIFNKIYYERIKVRYEASFRKK